MTNASPGPDDFDRVLGLLGVDQSWVARGLTSVPSETTAALTPVPSERSLVAATSATISSIELLTELVDGNGWDSHAGDPFAPLVPLDVTVYAIEELRLGAGSTLTIGPLGYASVVNVGRLELASGSRVVCEAPVVIFVADLHKA